MTPYQIEAVKRLVSSLPLNEHTTFRGVPLSEFNKDQLRRIIARLITCTEQIH